MEYEKNETSENSKNKSKIAFVFAIVILMVVLYIVMGILLIFTDIFAWQMSYKMRVIFGTVLVLYGLFRGYRAFKR